MKIKRITNEHYTNRSQEHMKKLIEAMVRERGSLVFADVDELFLFVGVLLRRTSADRLGLEENKAAQHIEEMHEFIAENQRLIELSEDKERELATAQAQRVRLALRDLTDAFAVLGGPTYANEYKNAIIALGKSEKECGK